MKPSIRAAVEVARRFDINSHSPILVQETNNSIVWLRPHEVIAKVGTHPDSAVILGHEHRVVSSLAALGAPVAPPVGAAGVEHHSETGFVVTLWSRLAHAESARESATEIGGSLRDLHQALETVSTDLPELGDQLHRAHAALFDDVAMSALVEDDRTFLRAAFEDLLSQLSGRDFQKKALHGEPHAANRLHTTAGIRWIDFEGACRGPLEWDLAFLPDQSLHVFAHVDLQLLDLLRTLNAARLATWCWVQARFPEMRRYGVAQLELVRARWRRNED